MAMTLPDLLIDVCHPFLYMHTDRSVRPKALPGKPDRQRLKLLRVQLYLSVMLDATFCPNRSAWAQ
ncbi:MULTISPECIES: hypothetical protein [Pseudomonas]|uniref:hypothetical protein n=1 Tax=Pseudomonas TaxID=286 RepID=UPI00166023E0|nr:MULTISPECIES: hypothetical protein [Pseudomonas]MCK8687811.1 hypothetical protein [Pseudomonas umsongensis]